MKKVFETWQRRYLLVGGVALASVVALVVPSVAGAVSPTPTAPTAVSGALGSFTLGVPAAGMVSADGSPAPTFALTGPTVPSWLFLDTNTGAITGTPNATAAYDFTVTASNSGGSASAHFTGTVDNPGAPTALSSTGSVESGNLVFVSVSADGSPAPTYAVTQGALPPGLHLNGITGVITGEAEPVENFFVEITTTNFAGSAKAAFTGQVDLEGALPTAVFASLGSLTVGTAATRSVTSDGSPAPTFDLSDGVLPVGLFLDAITGAITGTPTTAGPYDFTITAMNTSGSASTAFGGNVVGATRPTAVSASLGSLTVGNAAPRSVSADGSPAPTLLVTGTTPPGLTIAPNGTITGAPTSAGPYNFTVTATNSDGSATANFTGNVAAVAPTVVSGVLPSMSVGAPVSTSLSANGAPAPTFAVTVGALPAGLGLNGTTGAITGTPTTAGPYGLTVTASNSAGGATISFSGIVASPMGTARLTPLAPQRLLDTRAGGGPLAANAIRAVQVIGVNGVPTDSLAVVLNVTATGTTGAGYVTVFPCGTSVPDVSNLNFARGQTIANAATVTIGDGGAVCFYTSTTIHLIVDLNGAYNPTGAASLTPLSPLRLLDTRSGPKVGTGMVQDVQVAGASGVPADAVAAVLNVTATGTDDGAGYVTAFPCGTALPDVSNLNFAPGETIPNAVTVKIGDGGRVCLFTSERIHLIVDLDGIYTSTATASLTPLAPRRLLDTRTGGVRVSAGSIQQVTVAGTAGVPANAVAAVLNVTATGTDRAGFVTVFPCLTSMPDVSNLNFSTAETIANAVTVTIGAAGKVCLYTTATLDLIVDLDGVYTQPT